jgi:hypothetical protein
VPDDCAGNLERAQRVALYERHKHVEMPHAFTVEEQSGGPIPAHFHRVAQFQVVIGGRGRLGRHAVRSFAVHYADPYTAYGPVTPDEDATLSYFTLRARFDPGANYLTVPGVRDLLQPSRKRYLLVDSDKVGVSSNEALRQRTRISLGTLIPEEDDGLAAYLLRLPPGATATGPQPAAGGGQYFLVVNGEMRLDDAVLPVLSCVFVSSTEAAPLRATATDAGLEALVLQFPRSRS